MSFKKLYKGVELVGGGSVQRGLPSLVSECVSFKRSKSEDQCLAKLGQKHLRKHVGHQYPRILRPPNS